MSSLRGRLVVLAILCSTSASCANEERDSAIIGRAFDILDRVQSQTRVLEQELAMLDAALVATMRRNPGMGIALVEWAATREQGCNLREQEGITGRVDSAVADCVDWRCQRL